MFSQNTDSDELINNVLHSTESALNALIQLEQSLIKGRFKDGIVPYSVMCKTLVGQRLWSADMNHSGIDKNFNQISRTAKSIIEILQPYISNLEKLIAFDREISGEEMFWPSEDEIKLVEPDSDSEKVKLIFRKRSQKQMSYTSLRSELSWEKKRLDEALATMENKQGGITIVVSGSRKMISLL
jgi:hypothetical protein